MLLTFLSHSVIKKRTESTITDEHKEKQAIKEVDGNKLDDDEMKSRAQRAQRMTDLSASRSEHKE